MPDCAACGAALPAGARFCPACAEPVEAPAPSEERKLATVLFADLVGSTQLADGQDPERTRVLLDRFYEAMAAEVEAAGGTVEKFAGDAVMAAFGAPTAYEDHAERALHAALSMRRRLEELFGDELALRIGVNTGEVVVGRAREGGSFVTGDAVNVAARLEQAAAQGEILVGERTAAVARGAFEFAEPLRVEAKGKPGGVAARRLVRALSLMRPRGVGGLRRAFVGRESELDLLRATYGRAVAQGRPHLVTIMGEAGVGKTRLVREFWERLGDESPQPVRRTGRCLPYGRGITYWPLGEILKEHLGLLESDPADTVRARLGEREILGLALGLDIATGLHPLAARERFHDAWVDFLAELAAERPAVVLVEDVHWAEEPLLELLERILRDARGPMLLLCTARPELLDSRSSWGGGRRNSTIVGLESLTEEDAGRLLEELLAANLPPRLRALLVERSEGNPFFVEELIGALIDQGLVEQQDGGWDVHELPDDFAAPDSVQAVLAARIDLLGEAEKAALQAAAVIGRVFWPGPVRELVGGVEPDFDMLEERDFIRRRPGSSLAGEPEYAIKHTLTREVAYASLPKGRRARLHAAFAAWIERVGVGRDEWAGILAHHYAEAVRPEDADLAWSGEDDELVGLRAKATAWLRRAAQLAMGRYEIDEALAMLERALGLTADDSEISRLWLEIGHLNALKFDGEAFWTAMENAIRVCFDQDECAESYSRLVFHTTARSGMWNRLPDRDLVDGWIERALELASPESPARARALVAQAYWHPEKMDAAREASAIAEGLADRELRSYAFDARSITAFAAGEYEQASVWAERRLDLVHEITDPDHLADIYASPIPGHLGRGRFSEARGFAALHDEIAEELTPHHRVHGVSLFLEIEELAGDWTQIRELASRAERAISANAATPCVRNARSLLVCAVALEHLGEDEEARRLERAANELGMEGYGHVLDAPRLQLALVRRELDEASRLVAAPIVRRGQNWFALSAQAARLDTFMALRDRKRAEAEAAPDLVDSTTYLEPFALRALGVVREDENLVRRAAERFEAMDLGWHAAQTRALSR